MSHSKIFSPYYLYVIFTLIFFCNVNNNAQAAENPDSAYRVKMLSDFDPAPLYKAWGDTDTWDLMKKGSRYNARNCPDSALVCFLIISNRLGGHADTNKKKEWLAQADNNIGYIYGSYLADYQRAMQYFQRAESISQSINNEVNLAYVALNKGGLYMSCNRIYGNNLFLDEIWEYSVKGIRYALKSEEWPVALTSIINLSILYPEAPRPSVYASVTADIRGADIPEDAWMYDIAKLMVAGTESYAKGDFKEAAAIYSRIEDTISPNDLQAPRLKTVGLAATAEALAKAGEVDEAIRLTERWISIAKEAGMTDEVPEGHRKLWKYYAMKGDIENAESNRLIYLELKDSLMSAKEVTAITSIPLIARNDMLSAEINEERDKRYRLMTAAIISGCFLILLALYIVLLIRSRRRDREYSREIYRKYLASLEAEAKERELRRKLEAHRADIPKTMDSDQEDHEKLKKRLNAIPDDEGQRILDAISEAVEDIDTVAKPGYNISQLAERTGYPVRLVSQVINDRMHKNFRTFINEIRIKEVCKRLLDNEHYGQYTIEHIANSVGFQSRSNFSSIFKQVVGISAAEFRRNASIEQP